MGRWLLKTAETVVAAAAGAAAGGTAVVEAVAAATVAVVAVVAAAAAVAAEAVAVAAAVAGAVGKWRGRRHQSATPQAPGKGWGCNWLVGSLVDVGWWQAVPARRRGTCSG